MATTNNLRCGKPKEKYKYLAKCRVCPAICKADSRRAVHNMISAHIRAQHSSNTDTAFGVVLFTIEENASAKKDI